MVTLFRPRYNIRVLFIFVLIHMSSSFNKRPGDRDFDEVLLKYSKIFRESEKFENSIDNFKDELEKVDIRMPDVSPQKPDSYLCTSRKMPDDDVYIVVYQPHAKMKTAHHMLMFGCDEVYNEGLKGYWNCGEMGGTCKGKVNQIMYAWAKDAPALSLPKDVGFHVGGKSQIKFIVLQVHYANVDKFKVHHETDHSGVSLHLQSQKPKHFAGIYLVAAGGPPIPPKEKVFDMNMACHYGMGPEMHPFAFRVHTHKLGFVVTGYRVRNNKWHLIGKGDPQQPQAFHLIHGEESIQPGDDVAARCTYNSMKRDTTTYIGATGADEMCNFYIMYWYDPAMGQPTDACTYVQYQSSDYPSDTDEPFLPKTKMDMKLTKKMLLKEREWPKTSLEHEGVKAGQISGVAIDSAGNVVIFHRGDRKWEDRTFDMSNVLNAKLREEPIASDVVWYLYNKSGKVFKTWGKKRFYLPHGITIDYKDNMWFTDVGMHQVFKFSNKGKKELELGEKFVPGNDHKHFCKPTDVAVMTDGTFFVSDGYCNSRIVKFSASGKVMIIIDDHLLSTAPGSPMPTSFSIPHSVALDQQELILYVADRENGRVLAFETRTGKYKNHYAGFGDRVFAITYSPLRGGLLHVINGQSFQNPHIFGSSLELKTGKIIQRWRPEEGFSYPHDVACNSNGQSIYVSEITSPGRLWNFQEE